MNSFIMQKKLGLVVSVAAILILILNIVSNIVFKHIALLETLARPTVLPLLGIAIAVFAISRVDRPIFRYLQGLLFFILSGPALNAGAGSSFFGFWFLISGSVLLYKYAFFNRFAVAKVVCLLAWAFFWIGWYLFRNQIGSPISVVSVILFLLASMAILYIVFEENIRELVKSNSKKDGELEKQKALINQLEPLSVLGERVSHIAHSFKNNLTQLSAAVYYLEEGKDSRRAADKIRGFSASMRERIDNVLMVSHAGVRLEPEVIDLGRLLDGIKLIYLEEKIFLQNARYTLTADKGVLVRAVRWDIILLLENLLKNAIEAIVEKGVYGSIDITLTPGSLRVSNDGGALPQCAGCSGSPDGSCLDCQKIAKLGLTTKKNGSGTGLNQVFAAVKSHGWDIRLENSGETACFAIAFPVESAPE